MIYEWWLKPRTQNFYGTQLNADCRLVQITRTYSMRKMMNESMDRLWSMQYGSHIMLTKSRKMNVFSSSDPAFIEMIDQFLIFYKIISLFPGINIYNLAHVILCNGGNGPIWVTEISSFILLCYCNCRL